MNTPDPHAPLRVVQVVNVRWFNATAWYGLFLSTLLRDAGHEVRVLGLAGTECFDRARDMGLDPEPLDLNSAFAAGAAYLRLRRLVREFRPHIVNCHRGESFLLWGLLKKSGGFRLVRTRGDQRPPKGNFPNILLHAKAADAVIATSSGIAAGLREILRVPESRVHTILGGVDTRRFYPDAPGRAAVREALGLLPDQIAIGLVGRFDAVKGQKELLFAYSRLRAMLGDEARRLRLVLAGFPTSSTSEEAVRGWADAAGVAESVMFPGRCGDVRALMNALDLGVVASLGSETIARVALEIMACGVPLVGTRVGVMPDLLRDDALVPPGDAEATARALCRFVTEPAFGEGLRAAQHERMRDLGEKDFLEKTLAVYRGVLA
ncbi:Glycosyl transferase group 1 [uncultured delta proteobacterium]|uniref:Glycosyl transferase group 1 n=1 Tax=uncultured delta proteobacterium TaxID=34034 RepID=A0A212KHR3_9DELT|nr:Glycosyl transferase group 1 [uncultured delta proteobacterium]